MRVTFFETLSELAAADRRIVLLTGRLVVLSKHMRDVHRFGFPSEEALVQEGAKLVNEAVALIEAYPSVANY